MRLTKRSFTRALAMGAFLLASGAYAFPDSVVRVVVGFPVGGAIDGPARLLVQEMARLAGQPFIVENRPGASSNIAAQHVATSPPDGYTLFLSSSALSSSAALYKNVRFDSIKDFRHVGGFGTVPTLIVARKDLPVGTLQAVVDLAKRSPGKLSYGSPGTGSGSYMSGEILNRYAGTQIQHVPFNGSAPALIDLLGGHVDLMISGLPSLQGAIRGKQVKVLAVTDRDPSPDLVDAPTIAQALPGTSIPEQYQFSTWLGLSAPAGTPDAVIERLQSLMQQALQAPQLRQQLISAGVNPRYTSGTELKALIVQEMPAYARIVRELGISSN